MKLSLSRTLMRAKRDRLFRTIRVMKFTAFLIISVSMQVSAGVSGKESDKTSGKHSPFAFVDISGTIKDDKGEPVAGASIVVKGSTTGTSSDASGNFKLQVPGENAVLVISYVGFETQEVSASA